MSLLSVSAPFAAAQTPAALAAPAAPVSDFAASLALRTDRVVADSTRPMFGWLTQTSPVAHTSKGALRLKVILAPWEGQAKPVKELGTFTIYGGNLASAPVPFTADLRSVPDGFYRYVAELFDGETSVIKLEKSVVLVAGLEEKQSNFTQRVAKIAGHESAKASVLYPFDLARVINLGKRVYGSGNNSPEFGLTQAGVQKLYDFPAGLKASGELLTALEKGKDPVLRAGGERVRHYYMKEADEILPYRVFVPSNWNGKSALPLVFILHGNSRDQDYYFDRDGRIIPKTAEKHGFMMVAPLGYWPNGGYNYVSFSRERGVRGVAAAMAAPQQFGPTPAAAQRGPAGTAAPAAPGGGFGGVNGSTIPSLVRSEWSEQDAMHVFDLIKGEYPIDRKRIFLFGYSAGGQGGHYFAQKYSENWAAVAIGGSMAAVGPFYEVEKVKKIPMMVYAGSEDTVVPATKAIGEALKEKGVDATVKIYPGATHDSAPSAAVADAFEFFATHGRR
ncbi:MAG: dienelactone hydrolase family protein [Steroidobacteraceae bacterium]